MVGTITGTRRVNEAEEAALLAVPSPHLRSMIIAALDTGMRRGEMLALRFGDIDWKRRMIILRGATTRSRRTWLVPVGTTRPARRARMASARQ